MGSPMTREQVELGFSCRGMCNFCTVRGACYQYLLKSKKEKEIPFERFYDKEVTTKITVSMNVDEVADWLKSCPNRGELRSLRGIIDKQIEYLELIGESHV